jgi:hypothetical protein
MRNLFAVPWLTPCRRTLLSIVAAVILVFSIFALLKISSGGKQEPAKELLTGSIQKSAAVRKPPSDDQTASFLAPAASRPVQSAVVVRGPVPLPRPRPNRLGRRAVLSKRLLRLYGHRKITLADVANASRLPCLP